MSDTVVAGYRLVHELGAGRFSTSWLGQDPAGAAVVVKLLRSYAPDPGSAQRFIAEAQRLATSRDLDHPNVAHLLSGGVAIAQSLFLVYESGGEQTLADELRARGRVAPARALELCAQVAEGLAAMHKVFVLHLNLKPANIALTRLPDGTEQAVLLDVATAHLLSKSGVRPTLPLPLATAAYLAPEEAPDGRADLYSVGVLLFQLVSGRLPFMGATAHDLLRAHREQAPLRLRDAGRKVNEEFEALLSRLLSKDPTQRYSGGDELAVVLRSLIPIADKTPTEDDAGHDDPPPVAREPQLDPALERALLGEVPPQPIEKAPGVPDWMPRTWPAWWPRAAIAAAAAALLVALALTRKSTTAAVRPSPGSAAPARVDADAAAPRDSAAATAPAASAKVAGPGNGLPPVAAEPALVRPVSSADERKRPSPFAKQFDRAQKQLWTGQIPAAEATLHQIFAGPHLARRDRARAAKLMGEAETKRGNRPAALDWYRKATGLYDNAADREKVARKMRALQH